MGSYILLFALVSTGGASTSSQEFQSKEVCEKALVEYTKLFNGNFKYINTEAKATCVSKS